MAPIFCDIVCVVVEGTKTWEVIYNRIEDERPKITVTRATTDSTKPLGLQFRDASHSFLHKIGSRAKIFLYMDMVRWVIENLTIEHRKFKNLRMDLIGSFRVEDLKKMYHIPDPHDIYDKKFVANFAKKNTYPFMLIQGWRVLDNKFKYEKSGMYSIASLASPYNYVVAMLCRFYLLPNNTKFSIEWIHLIDACVNSHIMN